MAAKALYAGSFDPVTMGHLDIIERASRMFGHVVVAVGVNPKKPGLFTTEERVALLTASCKGIRNITIKSFSGLTADFASQEKCSVLVRGLRDAQDFGFEMQMAHMNHHLTASLETVFIPCLQQYSSVSSSLVKEVVSLLGKEGGKIKGLVPAVVEKALLKKFKK
ncbi:MAG: pantetheine-phosphate adenylyltransferase [Pseudomonadota bacterium]